MSDINRAVRMITAQRNVQAEVIRKPWPAEGIVYVKLYRGDDEEWTLLTDGCDYDTAYVSLQQAANRLGTGGGMYGVR